ncbi:hypothetical protein Aph01nite_02390 [Acrocarpospora phusangensis]|uniref:DUF3017 domain-containing protein n=1 Tax=Acrocarpospora phusangensis TaxID=1070424 RepID=A0A919Q407_9ACTN|nr:DUF3017 domain-containing protein [Acrocarpospora phusangensis]GIH21929.1 hypothetical protein Aph01nite_02390 [Acrocarpospora phusangensis]
MTNGEKTPWWPYLLVAAGAAVGLGLIALGFAATTGAMVMGVAMLAGAGLRLVVPGRSTGALAIRSRKADVLTLAVFGFLLVAGSLAFAIKFHAT